MTHADDIVTLTVLKETLLNLFKSYQPIAPVIAHRNLRMRGQAFISFPDREMAHKAKKEVAGFPLYGRPLVSRVASSHHDVDGRPDEANISFPSLGGPRSKSHSRKPTRTPRLASSKATRPWRLTRLND